MKELEDLAILNFFKKKKIVKTGDVGIYKDVLSISTTNDSTHTMYYDIYAKVRAISIYDNLIEVEIIDISTFNACSEDIKNLINTNMPKYIKPNLVKWEIPNESN
jgi:hypothetical protein